MKIAHLISHYPLPFVGGAEACVHHLATWQAGHGHEVRVVTPKRGNLPGLDYGVLPMRPGSVKLLMAPVLKERAFIGALRSYQKRHGFDVWQVTIGYPFGAAAVDFFNKENIPCVLRCSGEDIQREPAVGYGVRLSKARDAAIRRQYPKFDGFISIAGSIKREYLAIGIPGHKIYTIPNGVHRDLFKKAHDVEKVKKDIGIAPNNDSKHIILTVGRYNPRSPKKGLQYIPDIIEKLSARRQDFIWILIGHKNQAIRKMAEKRGLGRFLLTDEIRTEPSREPRLLFPSGRLIALYKSADVFAFPTLIEGGSNVITEALASGLPVVSTDADGVKDIVDNGKTGLLSKRGDAEGMAYNINRLLGNRSLRHDLSRNALDYTRDMDWSLVADRYVAAYRDVIEKKIVT